MSDDDPGSPVDPLLSAFGCQPDDGVRQVADFKIRCQVLIDPATLEANVGLRIAIPGEQPLVIRMDGFTADWLAEQLHHFAQRARDLGLPQAGPDTP